MISRKSFLRSLVGALAMSPVVCGLAEKLRVERFDKDEEVWYYVGGQLDSTIYLTGTKEQMERFATNNQREWFEVTNCREWAWSRFVNRPRV